MFSACGPGRARGLHARQLAVDDVPVQVQERQRLQPVRHRVGEQLAQGGLGDRPPAEAGDDRVAVQLDAGERHADVGRDDPADADGERLLEHDHALGVPKRGAERLKRKRAERRDPDDADRDALLAQLIDGVLDRAEHRAERYDDRLGVLAAIGAEQPAGVAPERLLKVGGDLRGSAPAPASAWRARGTGPP